MGKKRECCHLHMHVLRRQSTCIVSLSNIMMMNVENIKTPKGRIRVQRCDLNSLEKCGKCEAIISPKDKARHDDNTCDLIAQNGIHSPKGPKCHGFIRKDVLYARVVYAESKGVQLGSIPGNLHKHSILSSGDTLNAMSLSSGQWVQVRRTDGGLMNCVLYSDNSLKSPFTVKVFNKEHMRVADEEKLLEIRKVTFTEAYVVVFRDISNASYDAIEFTTFAKQFLDNSVVFEGMEIVINYDGLDITLSCVHVVESSISNVTDRLDCLNIQDGDQKASKASYTIGRTTRVFIKDESIDSSVRIENIGGLSKQIEYLRKIIHYSSTSSCSVGEIGLIPPRHFLLFGPPGTGKTMTIHALYNEYHQQMFCIKIDASSILNKKEGKSESKLKSLFDLAAEQSPSIVFIDDIESICPQKRNPEDKILSVIRRLLDNAKDRVVIIATTNKPDTIDISLRRPGRFDKEIEFNIPLARDRSEILQKILVNFKHRITNVTDLAESAHGFTGADLMLSCKEASVLALEKDAALIEEVDLKAGLRMTKPSAMREIMLEVPKVLWSEIGGMTEVKRRIEQLITWPLKYPEKFTRLCRKPLKGILMYGPPGCSKTMIAKALATESGLNFFAIKGPELFNKYVGESEKAVRDLFRRAKQASPSIIFFDEIDALASERTSGEHVVGDRISAMLLAEMDGVQGIDRVIIVAATNRPDRIDKALLRRGRFDSIIYVPLPDNETRQEIFRIELRQMSIDFEFDKGLQVQELANRTEGFSGAEITGICQEAGLIAFGENMNAKSVTFEHFVSALTEVEPLTSKDTVAFYEQYSKRAKILRS